MRILSRTALGALLIVAILLTACAQPTSSPTKPADTGTPTSKPPTTTPPPTSVVKTGPYGEFRIALSTFQTENLDHTKGSYGDMTNVFAPMIEWMFRMNGGDLAPGVIDKWEMTPDGLAWMYYIHKGIKFHNGEELTADDVMYSINLFMSKDARYAYLRTMIDRMEVVDDYTLKIYTQGKQPFLPGFSSLYSPGSGIVFPKDYLEKNGMDVYKVKPVGAGPFKFVRHVAGDLIEYEAVQNHWRQTPEFKKLMIMLIPEETARMAALRTNQVDSIDVSMESAREGEQMGYTVIKMYGQMVQVNLYGAYDPRAAGMPITNIKVRQALSLAINRDELKSNFFSGMISDPTPPYVPESSADIDTAYWMAYAKQAFRYDLAEAKTLIKEAGYADGFTIKFFTANQAGLPYLQKLAEVVQAYWAQIGVKAQLVPLDWGALKPMLQPRPAAETVGQAATGSMGENPQVVKSLMTGFHGTIRTYALVDKAMPELDKLLDDANVEIDPVKRKELVAKAIKLGTDSYTALMIGTAPSLGLLSPDIQISFPKPPLWSIALYADLAKHKK